MSRKVHGLTSVNNDLSNIEQSYDLSETAYSYGYDLRLKYSSFMQDTLNWVSKHSSALLSENNSKILSLGCGSGIFDAELIGIIQQCNSKWTFKGVDFSTTDLDLFRKKLTTLDRETQENVSLVQQKFTPSIDLGDRYDLITMIHFLHSFDDVLPVINNALSHLLADGKLLIVQQKQKGIAELREQFSHLLSNQKFHSSEKIKLLLEDEKIAFTSHAIETSFDVSVLKNMSLDALLLMSFCLSNDLTLLNAKNQEKIREGFLSLARKGVGGPHLINEHMEVIVCQAKNNIDVKFQ